MNDNHEQPDQFINKLVNDTRILKQARMLPMSTLTDEQIAQVRGDYFTYTNANAIYDAQVAKEIGVSPSVVSQFRSNQYKGDNEAIARRLNDWMENHALKQRSTLPHDYVDTRIAEEMQAVAREACVAGLMAAIVAPAGCGKTTVLKVLADKFRGRYFYCEEDHTPRQFLRALCRVCDVTNRNRSQAELIDAIVEKLEGTGRPLFLDEAHTLPKNCLSRVRAIHDRAGVPIIMVGTHTILESINDRSDGRGQFASRCLQYNCLEHIFNAETPDRARLGQPLFTREEVEKYLHNLTVKLNRDAFEMVWALACLPNHGTFRTVRNVVSMLRRSPESRATPIDRKEVKYALSLMFGMQGATVFALAERHLELQAA